MAIYEQFDVDPNKNNKAPPYGAPEKGMTFDQVTDTFRVVMAAIAELGKIVSTAAGAIGTIGKQNADAVQITGGTIDGVTLTRFNLKAGGGATVDAATVQSISGSKLPLSVIPLQVLYNYIYPVGCIRLSAVTNAADLYWPGVTATWEVLPGSNDLVIVGAGETSVGQGKGTHHAYNQLPFSGDTSNGYPGWVFQSVAPGTPGGVFLSGVHHDVTRYGMIIARRKS